jgi:hypothetical protein
MELKDFVAEALVQIQEGVQEAIERRGQNTEAEGVISPHRLDLKSFDPLNPNDWDKYVQSSCRKRAPRRPRSCASPPCGICSTGW